MIESAAENDIAANEDISDLEREAIAIDQAKNQANNPQTIAEPAIKAPSINAPFRPTLMMFLTHGRNFAGKQIPLFTEHYTEQVAEDIADSIIGVADVEGVDLSKIALDDSSRIGAWLKLGFAVGMPTLTFYFAYKAQLSQPAKVENSLYPAEAPAQ